MGEAVVLVGVTLARVLVDDPQVLIPVRPVHLVHSEKEEAPPLEGEMPGEVPPPESEGPMGQATSRQAGTFSPLLSLWRKELAQRVL